MFHLIIIFKWLYNTVNRAQDPDQRILPISLSMPQNPPSKSESLPICLPSRQNPSARSQSLPICLPSRQKLSATSESPLHYRWLLKLLMNPDLHLKLNYLPHWSTGLTPLQLPDLNTWLLSTWTIPPDQKYLRNLNISRLRDAPIFIWNLPAGVRVRESIKPVTCEGGP